MVERAPHLFGANLSLLAADPTVVTAAAEAP
jgi:hypothetical protein